MRHRHSSLHSIHFRVEGAQTNGAFEVFNGAFGLAVPSLTPGDNPRIGSARFEDWLSKSMPISTRA